MARRLRKLPDYFTEEEAVALVDAAPSYPTRMAFRIMLRTGLRVSETLALRRVDLRLDQEPPIIVVRADLVESLRDLAPFHSKDHCRPMMDISRQRIGQVMKGRRSRQGLIRLGPTPTPSGTPTAGTASCGAFRSPCCRNGWAMLR